jgi:hypothetical protein
MFPSLPQVKERTLATLYCTLPLYVFLNYALDPKKESNIPAYDVVKTLMAITKDDHALDYHLQASFSRALVPFYDGHLAYISNCYTKFWFAQPIVPVAVWDPIETNKRADIRVYAINNDAVDVDGKPIDTAKLTNARIVTIDGTDAFSKIQLYANVMYGKSKDKRVRLSRCTAFRYWTGTSYEMDRGAWAKRKTLPMSAVVTYEFETTDKQRVKVKIPWKVYPVDTKMEFSGAFDYWQKYCKSKATEQPLQLTTPMEEHNTVRRDRLAARVNTQPQLINGASDDRGTETTPASGEEWTKLQDKLLLAKGPGFVFFLLDTQSDNRVGVIDFTSFEYYAEPYLTQWKQGIKAGFAKFKELGVTKLILDVSNNGGGNVCLGRNINTLFNPYKGEIPTDYTKTHATKTQLTSVRLSLLFTALTKKAVELNETCAFRASTFINPATQRPYENSAVIGTAGAVVAKAGSISSYSMKLRDNCPYYLQGLEIDFKRENTAILSNGYCASTCAIVSGYFQEVMKVKTVLTTSCKYLRSTSISPPYSFAGGQMLTMDKIQMYISKFGLSNSKYAPPTFPTSASMFITYRQIHSTTIDKIPLEYYRQRSDMILPVTLNSVMRPWLLWRALAGRQGWRPCTNDCIVPNSDTLEDIYGVKRTSVNKASMTMQDYATYKFYKYRGQAAALKAHQLKQKESLVASEKIQLARAEADTKKWKDKMAQLVDRKSTQYEASHASVKAMQDEMKQADVEGMLKLLHEMRIKSPHTLLADVCKDLDLHARLIHVKEVVDKYQIPTDFADVFDHLPPLPPPKPTFLPFRGRYRT